MSARVETAPTRTIDYPEWIITLTLLAVMVGAYALTLGWPNHAAFFPRLLSGASIVLILVKIASMLVSSFAAAPVAVEPRETPKPAQAEGEIQLVVSEVDDEDQGNEDEFHKIFSRADGSMWGQALGWLALFFVGMYLFGLLVILPIFTVLYLRLVAKASWKVCFFYVLGTAGLMYVLFVMFLHLPLPQGVFPIFGE